MKCNTCNKIYEVMTGFDKYDQANGCAATLYLHQDTYYILAHYGSRFDMQRYALRKGNYEIGNVCDNCIEQMINDECGHLIEDGVW